MLKIIVEKKTKPPYMSNPLLEPIHGITIQDYSVISARLSAGIAKDEILNTLGINVFKYEEASKLWVWRMQVDSTFEIITLFEKYFINPDCPINIILQQSSKTGA